MRPRSVIPFLTRGNPSRQDTERSQTVLQVGRDNELLRLRAKIISSAGYVVRSMTPDQTLEEMRKAFTPRIWVLCHTLDFYELALLAVAIRSQCPADRLLRLTGLNDLGQAPGLFHELLEPITSVDDLLRVVAALAQRPRPENRLSAPLRSCGGEEGWSRALDPEASFSLEDAR